MEPLRVTLVQSSLVWEDPAANRSALEIKLLPLAGTTDLVVLPEMFSTGFSMRSESLAEGMDGPTVAWMQQVAETLNAVVTGSLIIRERGRYFNRLVWARPDGTNATYDKRHLFSLAGENHHYTAGERRLSVSLKGWNVCPLICYDLRFPAWSRNTGGYDLLVYVANWPKPRRNAWQALLVARAVENQAYVIGVNRVGADGNGQEYAGDSMVVGFTGEEFFHASQVEHCSTLELDAAILKAYRAKFPFLKDADDIVLK